MSGKDNNLNLSRVINIVLTTIVTIPLLTGDKPIKLQFIV